MSGHVCVLASLGLQFTRAKDPGGYGCTLLSDIHSGVGCFVGSLSYSLALSSGPGFCPSSCSEHFWTTQIVKS